ncbi:TPA: hypothetical protein QEN11_22875 [Stenotrophomonas maltophilia]|nr:hypothetical protein [Stenotrophomonas maltophilia]HEP1209683.1 hypothetical protein [Stenotrophomonas maltophilia]
MTIRPPLILDQLAARIVELAIGDTIDGNLIEGYIGRNLLINGNMDFFQRGSAGTRPDGESFTLDRWLFASLGTGTSNWGVGTFAIGDALPVPHPPRFFQGVNVVAGTNSAWVRQKIENVWSYAGGKATLSFWMRSAVAGKKVGVRLVQDFGGGSGASPAINIEGPVFTLTTAFQKYTATFDVPSLVGKTVGASAVNDCLQIIFDFAAASGYGNQLVGQTGLFEFTQVQFERGATATSFDRRPLALELMLCQRYYEKSYAVDVAPGTATRSGGHVSSALTGYLLAAPLVRFATTKRATPSVTLYNTQNGAAGQVSENGGDGLHTYNKPAAVDSVSTGSFEVFVSNGTASPGNIERVQWAADAEL